MDKIVIGSIAKAQGIKGLVKIAPKTDDLNRFSDLKSLFVGEKELVIEFVQYLVNGLFIKFVGIDTRNDAELLHAKKISILKDDAIKLEKDRYFIVDLVGCKIVVDGVERGILKDILQYGSADVYVVEGEKPFMFPAIKKVLKNVDILNKVITLDSKNLEEVAVYED